MSRDYGKVGIDPVYNVGGHVAEVHPGGICIHTLLNLEPEGLALLRPLGYSVDGDDKYEANPVHSIVPGGQVVKSVPLEPVGPCAPGLPVYGINCTKLELVSKVWHSAKVILVPFVPAAGVEPLFAAYSAYGTVIVFVCGLLAVTAVNAYATLAVVKSSRTPRGK